MSDSGDAGSIGDLSHDAEYKVCRQTRRGLQNC